MEYICIFLSNSDVLRLSIAWKYFLKTFAHSFDPWNERRVRLKAECIQIKNGLFEEILQICFRELEQEDKTTISVNLPPSFYPALFDFYDMDCKLVVSVRALNLWEPSFDELASAFVACQCQLETRDSNWGHNVLSTNLTFLVPPDDCFEEKHQKLRSLLCETDWVYILEIVLTEDKPELKDRWHTAITILAADLKVKDNKTLYAFHIRSISEEKFTVTKDELLGLLRTNIRAIELHSILLPSADDLGVCFRVAQKETQLVHFTIYEIPMGFSHVKALLDALREYETLDELELQHCSIRDEGAAAIAGFLEENRTLTKLSLDFNEIGDIGMDALFAALNKNTTLKWIGLERFEDDHAYLLQLHSLAAERGWTLEETFEYGSAKICIQEIGRTFLLSTSPPEEEHPTILLTPN